MRPLAAIPDQNHEILVRLLEILAPRGSDLVALIEAYFDESDSHDGAPALSVAGYLFRAEECRALDLEWKAVLDRFDLPFFHMCDCAHGNPPFDKLTKEKRIEAEKLMIGLIHSHALFGSVVSVNERDYNTWYARLSVGTAYTYCCWQALAGMREWMDRNNFEGEVAYFFEAGHVSQGEANAVMKRIFSNPLLRKEYRYRNHSFVPKETTRPVQAPDILAWLHSNTIKRGLRGETRPRADLVALVSGIEHRALIANKETVDSFLVSGIVDETLPEPEGVKGTWGQWGFYSPF